MFGKIKKRFRRRLRSESICDVGQLSDLDSSSIGDSDDQLDEDLLDGPTLVAVDDGKGGVKHITVPQPPDAQSDIGFYNDNSSDSCNGSHAVPITTFTETSEKKPMDPKPRVIRAKSVSGGKDDPGTPTIGELLRKEFKGRHMFHFDNDTEKLRKRLVSKRGVVHVGRTHLERNQRRKYLSDFFSTMLDMRWRWVLMLFTMSFTLSWLAFAVIWYLILLLRGDFEPEHLPNRQEESGWQPCVYAMYDFASCFLFSIETQHTIGYGSRQTSEKCPEAIFVMSLQSVIGVMIQACMVGTIFAKLARPKRRTETILFSKNAVVCRRDGYLCLCFRLANMRSSHLVECHLRAILISKKVTEEGESIPYHQTELNIGTDLEGKEDAILMLWPMTIVHRIDEESPFYTMSARDFLNKRYELILVLEGIVEPTGMSVQARTSYLPNEILWGYRFVNILNFNRRNGEYKVDYGSFNSLYKADTPTTSARNQATAQSRKLTTSSALSPLKIRSVSQIVPPNVSPTPTDITLLKKSSVLASLQVAKVSPTSHLSMPCLRVDSRERLDRDRESNDQASGTARVKQFRLNV